MLLQLGTAVIAPTQAQFQHRQVACPGALHELHGAASTADLVVAAQAHQHIGCREDGQIGVFKPVGAGLGIADHPFFDDVRQLQVVPGLLALLRRKIVAFRALGRQVVVAPLG